MKDKEVQGVLSPLRSESVASRRAQGVQDITLDDIISAARELRDEENAQISAKDLDDLIEIAPTSVGTGFIARQQEAPHTSTHGSATRPRWWAAAACLLGFLAGFGVKSALPSGNSLAVVSSAEGTPSAVPSSGNLLSAVPALSPDTIFLREVIRDTIFQTRVVVRDAEPKAMAAQAEQNQAKLNQAEQKELPAETPPSAGCSMLCDDIPYAYLAHN